MGPSRPTGSQAKNNAVAGPPPLRRVMIIEPDNLTRWSLGKYLGRWFEVLAVDTIAAAMKLLEQAPVDAMILSDDLSERMSEDLVKTARAGNPHVRVVCTVTDAEHTVVCQNAAACVEKPFDLSALAELLGRTATATPGQPKAKPCS